MIECELCEAPADGILIVNEDATESPVFCESHLRFVKANLGQYPLSFKNVAHRQGTVLQYTEALRAQNVARGLITQAEADEMNARDRSTKAFVREMMAKLGPFRPRAKT